MKDYLCITAFGLTGNAFNDRFRLRNLGACVSRVREAFPEADHVVEWQLRPGEAIPGGFGRCRGVEEEGPFHKTMLLNCAVRENPGYRAYVMVDADVYMTRGLAEYAMANCADGRLVFPYGDTLYLDEADTVRLCGTGAPWPGEKDHGTTIWRQTGLCNAFTRGSYDRVGGFDEAFSGWGAEDDAFMYKFRRCGMEVLRNPDTSVPAYHMFHPAATSGGYMESPGYRRNRAYCACIRRMSDADFSDYVAGRAAMDSLVDKYRALGRLELELRWRVSPTDVLKIDTTLYDIDRSGEITIGKILAEVLREDGYAGVVDICEHVLYEVDGMYPGMKDEVDRWYGEAKERCSS